MKELFAAVLSYCILVSFGMFVGHMTCWGDKLSQGQYGALAVLGIALIFGNRAIWWLLPRDLWSIMPGSMPYIGFTIDDKKNN